MQALLRAASGTCFSKSALKITNVHQQGPDDAWPGVAMAQALCCPHKGHRQGSMASCVMTEINQSLPCRRRCASRHRRMTNTARGPVCKKKSKMSMGLLKVPSNSMRHFSVKCGSGTKGAPAK
jgi:hypothetical protein